MKAGRAEIAKVTDRREKLWFVFSPVHWKFYKEIFGNYL